MSELVSDHGPRHSFTGLSQRPPRPTFPHPSTHTTLRSLDPLPLSFYITTCSVIYWLPSAPFFISPKSIVLRVVRCILLLTDTVVCVSRQMLVRRQCEQHGVDQHRRPLSCECIRYLFRIPNTRSPRHFNRIVVRESIPRFLGKD